MLLLVSSHSCQKGTGRLFQDVLPGDRVLREVTWNLKASIPQHCVVMKACPADGESERESADEEQARQL